MPYLIALGVLFGLVVVALAERFNDPASAGDPAPLASAEAGSSALVGILGGVSVAWTPPAAAAPWRDAIAAAELRYGIPQNLLLRQLDIESAHFAPDVVYGTRTSSAGAIGIGQFEPPTAEEYGVDPRDPMSSIDGAARYLVALHKQFGTWGAALAAYNWGPGHVARQGVAAAPQETRDYVKAILEPIGQLGS